MILRFSVIGVLLPESSLAGIGVVKPVVPESAVVVNAKVGFDATESVLVEVVFDSVI